jgi:hypothetical protein
VKREREREKMTSRHREKARVHRQGRKRGTRKKKKGK